MKARGSAVTLLFMAPLTMTKSHWPGCDKQVHSSNHLPGFVEEASLFQILTMGCLLDRTCEIHPMDV